MFAFELLAEISLHRASCIKSKTKIKVKSGGQSLP
jgi:hypothetical protein